ncbi:MAG: hypothetical protein FXV79_05940 [Candidatus Thioglobus sp.]|nr:MAG: hypothetical protein FXV79_05940 [Candidatus Thioglobus sp.]
MHKFFFLNGNNFNINCAGINNNSWLDSEMQNAQWLFGGNMVCRNEVFKQGFRFNHHFIRHSDYEDAMLSYQIYQFYGHGSLVYLPSFKLMHFESDDDNNTNVQALKMRTLYQFVLWRQMIFVQSPLNLLCYCHAQVGVMLVELVHPRRTKHRWLKFKTFLKTYFYILKNHKKIATNSIDFNQFILND